MCTIMGYIIDESLTVMLTHWGRDEMLAHWSRDEMDNISQSTFYNVFFSINLFEFRINVHWRMFIRAQITVFQHWLRKWVGAVQATNHYLNQWCLVYRCIYASLDTKRVNDWRVWTVWYSEAACGCLLCASFIAFNLEVICHMYCGCIMVLQIDWVANGLSWRRYLVRLGATGYICLQ